MTFGQTIASPRFQADPTKIITLTVRTSNSVSLLRVFVDSLVAARTLFYENLVPVFGQFVFKFMKLGLSKDSYLFADVKIPLLITLLIVSFWHWTPNLIASFTNNFVDQIDHGISRDSVRAWHYSQGFIGECFDILSLFSGDVELFQKIL